MCINWRLPVYSHRKMGIDSSKDTGVILLLFLLLLLLHLFRDMGFKL